MEKSQIQIKNIKLVRLEEEIPGFRPKVRGVVMNPVDHPHGGGEGRTSGGRDPVHLGVYQQKVRKQEIIKKPILL